jgi:DNA topoisomerase-1
MVEKYPQLLPRPDEWTETDEPRKPTADEWERSIRESIYVRLSGDREANGYNVYLGLGMRLGTRFINSFIESLGYDGIMHDSNDEFGTPRRSDNDYNYGRVWIAFNPEQIKATNNIGTFDPDDPRMRYAGDVYPPFRRRERYAIVHAPAGGAVIGGKEYPGGEFTPAGAMALGKHDGTTHDGARSESDLGPASLARRFAKPKATIGEMVPVRRIGKGKEAKLVKPDGSDFPSHVRAASIPPAWTDVTVAVDADSDVQVKGRDAAGRPVTKYRPSYVLKTQQIKFARIDYVMRTFPKIMRRIEAGRNAHSPLTRAAADAAWLIAVHGIRPGSAKDTKAVHKAYGATTLLAEHVKQERDGVYLDFPGKSGVHNRHLIADPALATMLIKRKLTAQRRGGRIFDISPEHLNSFIKSADAGAITAKDLRTRLATQTAINLVNARKAPPATHKDYKASVKAVAELVARKLGNKPSEALKSYINPAVFAGWAQAA